MAGRNPITTPERPGVSRRPGRWGRWRRALARVAGAVSVGIIGVAVWVAAIPFPSAVLTPHQVTSTLVVDREGRLLREVLSAEDARGRWVALSDLSPHLVDATVHAEDRRFWDHAGLDGLAIGRSIAVNARSGRAVTGASTITQQTVKLTLQREAPRTLGTKLMEAVWALRLELALSKEAILEQYLNRAPYGNQLHGAEAAARGYFGKPAAHLSLAEAALLAGLPQSPTRLDPRRDPAPAIARQRLILERMHARGVIAEDALRAALAEPIAIRPRSAPFEAPHLLDQVTAHLRRGPGPRPAVVRTTLDLRLQDRVSAVLAHQRSLLAARGGFQAAAVVLDTQTSEVLAWVGSRGYWDEEILGANDGVTALRQPGSALKPFVYAAYLERGGSPADALDDAPTELVTATGVYRPKNFDRLHRGPVTLREALASSLNIPAVLVAQRVGPDVILETLRRLGLETLDRPPSHYGPGIALGNGEVRLVDLAAAYAALGRLGEWRPVRWVLEPEGWAGQAEAREESRRVLEPRTAFALLDMLTDDRARESGFGQAGPMLFPYRVAVKTGTSSDYRDNWAVAVTPRHTVAVWVGNFDGRPMNRVSGALGATPTMRQIVQLLYPRAAAPGDVPWYSPPPGLVQATLCAPRGTLAGPDCGRPFREWLTPEQHARARVGDVDR